jgi:hypothetical protein
LTNKKISRLKPSIIESPSESDDESSSSQSEIEFFGLDNCPLCQAYKPKGGINFYYGNEMICKTCFITISSKKYFVNDQEKPKKETFIQSSVQKFQFDKNKHLEKKSIPYDNPTIYGKPPTVDIKNGHNFQTIDHIIQNITTVTFYKSLTGLYEYSSQTYGYFFNPETRKIVCIIYITPFSWKKKSYPILSYTHNLHESKAIQKEYQFTRKRSYRVNVRFPSPDQISTWSLGHFVYPSDKYECPNFQELVSLLKNILTNIKENYQYAFRHRPYSNMEEIIQNISQYPELKFPPSLHWRLPLQEKLLASTPFIRHQLQDNQLLFTQDINTAYTHIMEYSTQYCSEIYTGCTDGISSSDYDDDDESYNHYYFIDFKNIRTLAVQTDETSFDIFNDALPSCLKPYAVHQSNLFNEVEFNNDENHVKQILKFLFDQGFSLLLYKDDFENEQYPKLNNSCSQSFYPIFYDNQPLDDQSLYLYWLSRHYFPKDLSNIIINLQRKDLCWYNSLTNRNLTLLKKISS